jgi:hypothetical protein
MLYTKEQIKEMDLKTANKCLKTTEYDFQVDKPLTPDNSNWAILDEIANQLLWLEDHIHELKLQAAAEERATA